MLIASMNEFRGRLWMDGWALIRDCDDTWVRFNTYGDNFS